MEVFEEMNCNDCSYFFTEWDDMERRQIGYCCYKSNVTGLMMDMAEKGFKCPQKERKMDDHIITIGDANGLDGWKWKMTVDLKELAASAGVRKNRKRPYGGVFDDKVISVPIPRAKKLLQLIRKHGTEDDFRKCDEYLRPNVRLHKYWRELCE